jgi:hypothetical protein
MQLIRTKKHLNIILAAVIVLSFVGVNVSTRVLADSTVYCTQGQVGTFDKPCISRGGTDNNGNAVGDAAATSKCGSGGDCNGLIAKYANPLISAMAAAVGLVVVISIILGGIQYASANADPQKITAAKQRITNAVIALLCFLFLYVFLQWLIPGGYLNG